MNVLPDLPPLPTLHPVAEWNADAIKEYARSYALSAVLKERERCAAWVENEYANYSKKSEVYRTATKIAAALRTPNKRSTKEIACETKLTAEDVRAVLDYDQETGIFRWRCSHTNAIKTGGEAGTHHKDGYVRIIYKYKGYLAHRLAWLYVYGKWPELHIDHINGIKSDNRINNLRDVSRSVNMQNVRVSKGACGLLGVFKNGGKYQSAIRSQGKNLLLGSFASPEEAHEAYLAAKRRLHEGCTI